MEICRVAETKEQNLEQNEMKIELQNLYKYISPKLLIIK